LRVLMQRLTGSPVQLTVRKYDQWYTVVYAPGLPGPGHFLRSEKRTT